jgi:toxin secretion/phage lysis holin
MKNKIIKISVSAIAASVSAYFKAMLIPAAMLIAAMLIDYISGVAAAWFSGTLNSKTGKHGAVKKVCYMILVVAAGIIDWVICCGLAGIGIEYELKYYFGLVVTIWLILNELLSILENCTRIGIPIPGFIKPVAMRLKIMVDKNSGEGDE